MSVERLSLILAGLVLVVAVVLEASPAIFGDSIPAVSGSPAATTPIAATPVAATPEGDAR